MIVETLETAAIYEAGADLFSAFLGAVMLFVARRLAPRLSLLLHRRVFQVFVFAAVFFVLAKLLAVAEAILGLNVVFTILEDVAETLVIVCLGAALYLLYRSEQEEVAALRRSAEVD